MYCHRSIARLGPDQNEPAFRRVCPGRLWQNEDCEDPVEAIPVRGYVSAALHGSGSARLRSVAVGRVLHLS